MLTKEVFDDLEKLINSFDFSKFALSSEITIDDVKFWNFMFKRFLEERE